LRDVEPAQGRVGPRPPRCSDRGRPRAWWGRRRRRTMRGRAGDYFAELGPTARARPRRCRGRHPRPAHRPGRTRRGGRRAV